MSDTFSALAAQIGATRMGLQKAEEALIAANYTLEQADVAARTRIIMAEGGDFKRLGPNEKAQETEMKARLAQDAAWLKARFEATGALIDKMRAHVLVTTLEDARRGREWDLQAEAVRERVPLQRGSALLV